MKPPVCKGCGWYADALHTCTPDLVKRGEIARELGERAHKMFDVTSTQLGYGDGLLVFKIGDNITLSVGPHSDGSIDVVPSRSFFQGTYTAQQILAIVGALAQLDSRRPIQDVRDVEARERTAAAVGRLIHQRVIDCVRDAFYDAIQAEGFLKEAYEACRSPDDTKRVQELARGALDAAVGFLVRGDGVEGTPPIDNRPNDQKAAHRAITKPSDLALAVADVAIDTPQGPAIPIDQMERLMGALAEVIDHRLRTALGPILGALEEWRDGRDPATEPDPKHATLLVAIANTDKLLDRLLADDDADVEHYKRALAKDEGDSRRRWDDRRCPPGFFCIHEIKCPGTA